MAQKRMFSKDILSADRFLDLSPESQALYLHLSVQADDEGFVGSSKKILRMLGLKQSTIDELHEAEYVHLFDSGICVINHWHIHNWIRKDRLSSTIYTDEKAQVQIDDRGIYVLASSDSVGKINKRDNIKKSDKQKPKSLENTKSKTAKKPLADRCQTDVRQMSDQYRVDKNSIDKCSVV